MQNIERVTVENAIGDCAEQVIVTHNDGSQTVWLASVWNQLEAQREQSGTL